MDEHERPETPPTAEDPAADAAPGAATPDPPAAGAAEPWRRWMPRRRAARDETAAETTDASAVAPDAGAPDGDGPPAAPEAAASPGGAPARRPFFRRRPAAPADTPADAAAPPVADDGADVDPADATEPTTPPVGAAATEGVGRLRRRRTRLVRDRELAVYHLGGLAFELYRRDLLSEEVMRRRAGAVALIDEAIHDIDLRLDRIEAERRERRTASRRSADEPAGNCLTCRAPFRHGAQYCWQCGTRLVPADPELDLQVTEALETRGA